MEDTKESRPSIHYKADAHITLHRPCQLAKGLHGYVPDVVLEMKEVDTSPNDRLFLIASHLTNDKLVLYKKSHWENI